MDNTNYNTFWNDDPIDDPNNKDFYDCHIEYPMNFISNNYIKNNNIEPINFVVSIGDSCVSSNLIRWNNARTMTSWDSFIFDWARSNMSSVCDILKNGLDWHIENNVNNEPISYNDFDYNYPSLYYHHHLYNKEWQIKSAERFFKLLETQSTVMFLYMSTKDLPIEKLNEFIQLIIEKYKNIKFKVVTAKSLNQNKDNKITYEKANEYLDLFYCDVQFDFMNFVRQNRRKFYENLFNILIPYKLDIKDI